MPAIEKIYLVSKVVSNLDVSISQIMIPTIYIESFNPYECIFPDRKVLTREILNFIKDLRAKGINVIVNPNDGRPIEYLYKKGFSEFLSDPSNLFILSAVSSLVTGVTVTLITEAIKNYLVKSAKVPNTTSNIFISKDANLIIDLNGVKIASNSEIADGRIRRKKISNDFRKIFEMPRPYADLPIPILFNHKPRLVGWCSAESDKLGMKITDGYIFDKAVKRKVDSGKYNGLSVTGIATKIVCDTCGLNYIDCNHITGETYRNTSGSTTIHNSDFIEISVVREPINTGAFIKLRPRM